MADGLPEVNIQNAVDYPVDRLLDGGQSGCGELLILVFEAMKQLKSGQILKVIGYDLGAREDIPAWCRLTGNPLLHVETAADRTIPTSYFIQKG